MVDAILGFVIWINETVIGMGGNGNGLTASLADFLPQIYQYVLNIMSAVTRPVAYTILALFFVLELVKISSKVETASSGSRLGVELIFKTLIRLVLCKLAIDNVDLILHAIFDVSVYLTTQIQGIVQSNQLTGFLDQEVIRESLSKVDFFGQLGCLMMMLISCIVVIAATVFTTVLCMVRFIEVYVYFAVSPIPMATLPSEELSGVAKNFLKAFCAAAIQGTLIYLVISFFPALYTSAFTQPASDVLGAATGALCYGFILLMSIFATGRWAKSITNSM